MHLLWTRLRHTSALLASALVLAWGSHAFAAEQVVLRYRIFQASIPVDELTLFAETGEATPGIQSYLRLSRQEPETVRRVFTQAVPANVVLLDRVLNSWVGEQALDQLGQIIRTPSGQANRQALRSAIILSASQNGQLSLLSIVQNYPTQELHIEGDRVEAAYRQLRILAGGFLSRWF